MEAPLKVLVLEVEFIDLFSVRKLLVHTEHPVHKRLKCSFCYHGNNVNVDNCLWKDPFELKASLLCGFINLNLHQTGTVSKLEFITILAIVT